MSAAKFDELERLLESLRRHPNDKILREELCALLIEQGDWPAALTNALFLVQLDPQSAFAHLAASRARLELGRHPQAQVSLATAQQCSDYPVRMRDDSALFGGIAYAIAKAEVARIKLDRHGPEKAPQIQMDGESLDPRERGEHAFFLYAYKAPSLEGAVRRKLIAYAEAMADEVLLDHPLDINALRTSVGIKIDSGRLDAAFTLVQKAFDLNPKFPDAHFLMAEIHQRRAQYKEAIPHLEAVVEYWPTNRSALSDLAYARDRVAPWSWARFTQKLSRHSLGLWRTFLRLILRRR